MTNFIDSSQNSSPNLKSINKSRSFGIKNVDLILDSGIKRKTTLEIENGLIKSIGTPERDEFIDAKGFLVSPGLINSHTHTAMTFLRDLAHSTDDVIGQLFFKTEKQLNSQLVEKLSYSFLVSALRSGTTCVFDHYYFHQGVAAAVDRLGMKAFIGETLADIGGAFPSYEAWNDYKATIENWAHSSRIKPLIAPHATDTVSDKLGAQLGEYAKKHKLPLHFHISQRTSEFEKSLKENNCSPVKLAHKRNWLGENSLAVHLLYLDKGDLELLAGTNTTVVNCPSSQIIYEKLAPIEKFYDSKINIALGTDSNASSDQADIISELKTFTLLLKDRGIKDENLYKNCFRAITDIPAKAVGAKIAEIKEGFPADLVFIKQDVENLPLHEIWTHFIFSIQSSQVQHVMIDGQWTLWDRMPTMASESDLRSEYLEAITKIKL